MIDFLNSSNELNDVKEGTLRTMRFDVSQIAQVLYNNCNYFLNSCSIS
jgi:hypothetical protein